MDVVILCGGIGSRMQSLNKDIPKILLPLCGMRLLEWQMRMISVLPIDRIILATHYMSNMIERNNELRKYSNINLSKANRLLDTGGALKHAIEKYRPISPIMLVMNGDILCNVNLHNMFINFKNSYDCLMLTSYSDKANEYGSTTIYKNRIISFTEKDAAAKSGYINGGIYLFSSSILNYLPEKAVFSLEYDVFPYLDRLYSYRHSGMWHDIGTPSRYCMAVNDLNKFIETRQLTMPEGPFAIAA